MGRKKKQLELDLRTWGGSRPGAGRKPKGARPGVSHAQRSALSSHHPVHVTWRMLLHVWNLRSRRCFGAIAAALARARHNAGFRVIHFAVLGNHLHLIVEAVDEVQLARGLQGFAVWMARRLNAVMHRRGTVFADRYHAHQLRSLAETRNAIRYVVENYEEHARRRGEIVSYSQPDPYSSACETGRTLVSAPKTWLLRRASALPTTSASPPRLDSAEYVKTASGQRSGAECDNSEWTTAIQFDETWRPPGVSDFYGAETPRFGRAAISV